MAGKAKRPGYDELAAQVATRREQVRALKEEVRRPRAENAALRGDEATAGAGPEGAVAAAPAGRQAPPRWAKANVARRGPRRPRPRRAPVPGRRRAGPARRLLHAPAPGPRCAAALHRGRVVGRRPGIARPAAPVPVVEPVVLERRCPRCGARCRGVMPDLSAQVGTHRRVSWRVVALVAARRAQPRLPIAQLQWPRRQVWGRRLAGGARCGLLAAAARAGRATYEARRAAARASPVAHVDETGWRADGQNGYVGTVSTPPVRLFHDVGSRAGAVGRELLGAAYAGVTVSDCSAAYDQLDGLPQRGWAQEVRDIDALPEKHPRDAGLHAWGEAGHALYERAVAWAAAAETRRPAARAAARLGFERELLAPCRAPPAPPPHAARCRRVERDHPECFPCVAAPAVPPTTNLAERARRPLGVARKISGATRAPRGAETRMRLQSLVATWDLRGQDPGAAMLDLLRAPRPTTPNLAPV